MKRIYLFILLIPFFCFSQQKNQFFFGAEVGLNTITSYNLGEDNKSFQGGFVAEYYFISHLSLSAKLKYFDTGVSFERSGTGGTFFNTGSRALIFKGSVLSLPITLNWNYKCLSKLMATFKSGFAYNFETRSQYELAKNLDTNAPKSFVSLTGGFGLQYIANKKTIIFIDFDTNLLGGFKGTDNGFLFSKSYYTNNNLLSIGIKQNFKK